MVKEKAQKKKLATSINEYFGGGTGEVSITAHTMTINCTPDEIEAMGRACIAGAQHYRRQRNGRPTSTLKSHLEPINTVQLVFTCKSGVLLARQKKMSWSVLGRLFRRRA